MENLGLSPKFQQGKNKIDFLGDQEWSEESQIQENQNLNSRFEQSSVYESSSQCLSGVFNAQNFENPKEIIAQCNQRDQLINQFKQENQQFQQDLDFTLRDIESVIIQTLKFVIEQQKKLNLENSEKFIKELNLFKKKNQNLIEIMQDQLVQDKSQSFQYFYEIKNLKQEMEELHKKHKKTAKSGKILQKEIFNDFTLLLNQQKSFRSSKANSNSSGSKTAFQQSMQKGIFQKNSLLELNQTKSIYPQNQENTQKRFLITHLGIQNQPNFQKGIAIGGRKKNQDDPIDIEFKQLNVEVQQFKISYANGF